MTIEIPLTPSTQLPRAALIAGPTATGKSALATALGKALIAAGRDAVVINADASQVYADLAILSARPTEEEMDGVPHTLFGHVDGATDYNAPTWAGEARAAIDAAHSAGAIPIIVGGTGLYMRTLLHGIAPVPAIDDEIRAAVRAMPVHEAYRRLQSADPAAAARLKRQDTTRIARALEVVTATGTPLHIWQEQRIGGIGDNISLYPQILLPPRDWLRERCDIRLAAMFANGAADEVRTLLARNLHPDLPVMRAIGVRQLAQLESGEIDSGDALTLAQAATRQYAKRQTTWFKNQFPADWPRWTETLNHIVIDNLAIKLRDRLLTA
jgi:tRNA dimethylallyltransferase